MPFTRSVLLVALLAMAPACSCPPMSGQGGSRSGTHDPSSVTFAFFGGLRCFFGDSGSSDEGRAVADSDLSVQQKDGPNAQAAALTLR